MRVIVVTGSRDGWNDQQEIRDLVAGADVLIVGDADGVDLIARRHFRALAGVPLVFHADWKEVDHGAGPERNAMMCEVAALYRELGHRVEAHAFPGPASRGTWNAKRQLEGLGFVVVVHQDRAVRT